MSGRRMWGLGSKRLSADGLGRGNKYSYKGGKSGRSWVSRGDDEGDEIAVVSNPEPDQIKYGSGIAQNGPRYVPGIITSRQIGKRMSFSGTRLGSGSLYPDKPPLETLKSNSVSRQSLLDVVSSKISLGSRKVLSRESFSTSYVHRANAASELDISRKTREARKRDIKNRFSKMEKWETSTSSSERPGCRWTFVFDPAGRLCYYWTAVVSLAFLYNTWVMMYRFAFNEIYSDTIVMWFCLDYFADFVYVLDILFHFRTGYLEDGVLQTDARKLRRHYMNSTTFYIDCLCLLPLDFLYLSIGFKSILRCFRLVKIYKFWNFLDRTERHTNSPNLFRSVSLIHYLFVIFHWNACVFNLIYGKRNNKSSYISRWLNHEEVSCPQTLEVISPTTHPHPTTIPHPTTEENVAEYLEALYWCTLSLTTVGGLPRPCNKYDYIYQIWQLMFGLLLFATVLGHIANIVTNVSAARKEFQAKLDGVKTYMRMRRVPAHLQGKVIKWFDYLWLTQKCSDEEKAVSCLPDKLKAEMAIHVHLDTLKRVEIFQNTEAGFLCELVLRLRPVLFSPGDYICRKGEVGKEMYIVNRGRLQVVADNGKTMLATLKAGSYFGEISILNMGTAGNRRTASVRSVGYSDLFVLSKKDMWDVLKEYPAARVRLEAIAAKRLEKYKKVPLEKDHARPIRNRKPLIPRVLIPTNHPPTGGLNSASHLTAALGRSSSTPGMLESAGRVPLEEMCLAPVVKQSLLEPLTRSGLNSLTPGTTPIPSPSPSRNKIPRAIERERQPVELVLSDSSSRHSHSTDEEKPLNSLQHYSVTKAPSARSGTTASVASCDSTDRKSASTSNVVSPMTSPNYATANVTYTLPVPPPSDHVSPASDHICSASLSAPVHFHRSCYSVGALPRETPHDVLLGEIRRLRENLASLMSENANMSVRLSQQQWEVEHRLHEIEMQLCGNMSNASSNEDNERNRESII